MLKRIGRRASRGSYGLSHTCPVFLCACGQDCWADDPEDRPEFEQIVARLEAMLIEHPRADFPSDVANLACFAKPSSAAVSRV